MTQVISKTGQRNTRFEGWNIDIAYKRGDTTIYNGSIYSANDDIPAGTSFIIGTVGATWQTSVEGGGQASEIGAGTPGNVIVDPNGVVTISAAGTANVVTVNANGMSVAGNLQVANVGNFKLPGGSNGQFLRTDGTGNLSWAEAGSSNGNSGITTNSSNLTMVIDGNTVQVIAANGTTTTGNANVSGNITANGTVRGNVISGNTANFSGNITGGNVTSTGTITGNTVIANTANFTTINLAGNSNLGDIGNLHIGGGNAGEVLATDGTGNLYWSSGTSNGGSGITTNTSNVTLEIAGNTVQIIDANGTSTTGNANVSGNTNVAGNIIGGNITSNGSLTTQTVIANGNITSNGTVSGNTIQGNTANFSGNVTGGNITTSGNVTSNGTISGNVIQGNTANFSGNVTAGNITSGIVTADTFIGNAAGLTNIIGANVTGVVANANYSAFSGNVVTASQPNITSLGNLTTLTVGGTSQLGDVGNVKIDGGAAGQSLVTDGTGNLTWSSSGTAENANIANFANFAGNVTVAAQSNITTLGSLTALTVVGISDLGANANVKITGGANGQVLTTDGTGNLTWTSGSTTGGSGVVPSAGNVVIEVANTVIQTIDANGTTTTGNANVSGNITANGTITANTFTGNATGLTNIPGANVTGIVPRATSAGTANFANFAGNVTVPDQPTITSLGTLTALAVAGTAELGNVANIKILGGAAGQTLATDGTGNLTWSSSGTAENANIANFANFAGNVTVAAQPNITSVGTLANLDVTGNVDIGGDLNVIGNLNYANVGQLVVSNSFIYIADGNPGDTLDMGLVGETDGGTYNGIVRDTVTDTWRVFGNLPTQPTTIVDWANTEAGNFAAGDTSVANLTASGTSQLGNVGNVKITGGTSGQFLRTNGTGGLTWASISFAASSNFANYAGNVTTPAQPGITSVGTLTELTIEGLANLGNVANVKILGGAAGQTLATDGTGNLSWSSSGTAENANIANFANFAGNITVASQPNITFVGTLTSLAVSGTSNLGAVGNITITGGSNGQLLSTNGSGVVSWVNPPSTDGIANGTSNIGFSGANGNIIGYINAGIALNIESNNLVVGTLATAQSQGVAIGTSANSGTGTVSVGHSAGGNGTQSVAIGFGAGANSNVANTVIIGANSAPNSSAGATVLGANIGNGVGANSVIIGYNAAANGSGANAIVINASGNRITANANSLYVTPVRNTTAGNVVFYNPNTKEMTYGLPPSGVATSIANGDSNINFTSTSGNITMNIDSNSVGLLTLGKISFGDRFGATDTANANTISIGPAAGLRSQAADAIAIGASAGEINQGAYAVAIGQRAGTDNQGAGAIAIGGSAALKQGAGAIAIGNNAANGNTGVTQGANSIVINATGSNITVAANALYVAPIRNNTAANVVYYNPTTKEVSYGLLPTVDATKISNGTSNVMITGLDGDIEGYVGGNMVMQIQPGYTSSAKLTIGQNADSSLIRATIVGHFSAAGQATTTLGASAGNVQSVSGVHVGYGAGALNNGGNSVTIGANAGTNTTNGGMVIIGAENARSNPGANSISIGNRGAANNSGNNSIVLNASGAAITASANSFYVNPVRNNVAANTVFYDPTTKELTYGIQPPAAATSIANGTSNIVFTGANGNISMSIAGNSAGSLQLNKISFGDRYGVAPSAAENTVSIGPSAGLRNQSANGVAIGAFAGEIDQGANAVAIGGQAGLQQQGANAVAIGFRSSMRQGTGAIAIGANAANSDSSAIQAANTVVINATGSNISATTANALYVAPIRNNVAANTVFYDPVSKEVVYGLAPAPSAIANGTSNIGFSGANGNIVFNTAANTVGKISVNSVVLGDRQGFEHFDLFNSVAIGTAAGKSIQMNDAVAIGGYAGENNQGSGAVAVGYSTGVNTQGQNAVAIGKQSSVNQNAGAIAIGYNAVNGVAGTRQASNSIVINATGSNITAGNAALYMAPIRNNTAANTVFYNPATKEITYGLAPTPTVSSISDGLSFIGFTGTNGNIAATVGSSGAAAFNVTEGTITTGITTMGSGAAAVAGSAAFGAAAVANGNFTTSIGPGAGGNGSSTLSTFVGWRAGISSNVANAIAIGANAGANSGAGAISIGYQTGSGSGANSIAIGINATNQLSAAGTITLNATGSAITASTANAFYVAPIRNASSTNVVFYNPSTKEVTYGDTPVSKDFGPVNELFQTFSPPGATITLDCSIRMIMYAANMTQNPSVNLTNLTTPISYGTVATVFLQQGSTAYMITSLQIAGTLQTIKWQGGAVPSGNANKLDVVAFTILRTGPSTYVVTGQLVSYG